jgi:hypothetical protein
VWDTSAYAHTDTNGYTDSDTNGYTDSDANGDPNSASYAYTYSDAECNAAASADSRA